MIINIISQPVIYLLRKNDNEALSKSQTPPERLTLCILHIHRGAGSLPEPPLLHMLPAIRSVVTAQCIVYVAAKF